jgi:hypothetical protein
MTDEVLLQNRSAPRIDDMYDRISQLTRALALPSLKGTSSLWECEVRIANLVLA